MGQDTKNKVSPEEIEKALDILGLDKSILEKSEASSKIDSEEEKEGLDLDKKPEMIKSEDFDDDDDEAIQKAISEKEEELKEMKSNFEAKKKKKEPKSDEDEGEFKKGVLDTLSTVLKETQELNRNYSVQNEILKSQIDELNSKIDSFGSQSNGRKSISKPIEKSFDTNIEKSESSRSGKSLSKSRDKAALNQILFSLSGIEKGEINDFYKNATLNFEASGNLEKSVELDLNTRYGLNIED